MAKTLIHREPKLFVLGPKPDESYKLALGLDLGGSTGWSYTHFLPGKPWTIGTTPVTMGQWSLDAQNFESGALRFLRLRQFVAAVDPDLVIFEQIRNTPAMDFAKPNKFNIAAIASRISNTAQLFGAFMGTVATYCEEYNIPCMGIGIGEIKKRATGAGNASKEAVIEACNAAFGTDFDPATYTTTGVDNIADSAWCLVAGLEGHAMGMTVSGEWPGGNDVV